MSGQKVERFLTTVLFTDIVGSTQLAAELGDRAWRDLVQEHHRLVRAALRRHGGREVDTAGDSFFAVFDAPAGGVECALDVIEAVKPIGLEVRAGLHVGEVEQIAGKIGGITVPISSRIMSIAGPSEVLVSSTVRDLAAGSGFRFEDKGVRELKGVPGEWRLFAVSRSPSSRAGSAEAEAAEGTDMERAARRTTAVRRAQSRPIWQRHPRAAVATVVGVALLLGGGVLLVWSPWLPRALPDVGENSLGVIDPGRNVIIGQAQVGNQPAAIAFGEGYVWIVNAGDDSVSVADPASHAVVDTIDVGRSPADIAVGAGSVWVANAGERSVTRINAATRRVVDTIAVGNGPRAIAFAGHSVWVANSGDATVTRIDSNSGVAGDPIAVTSLPSAIAADETGVWVASEDGSTVTHLDPASGVALAAPIAVGTRPDAIALSGGDVWVANSADASLSRISAETNRVIGVADVGGTPLDVAVIGSSIWVADGTGALERVDPSNTGAPPVRIATGSAPQALAGVGSGVWFVSRASSASHRGGTERVVSENQPNVDPDHFGYPEFSSLLGDGLVGYRRVGGVAGSQLLPDLATSMPAPADGGLTYAFHLRNDIVYSDGMAVSPGDFRFAIERSFQVGDPFSGSPAGPGIYGALLGADACTDPTLDCDLSRGIVTDDGARTVTFHLSQPDPDFTYKLAFSFAYALREGSVPAHDSITGPYPVTGPYEVASVSGNEVRLERNPNFHSWDQDVRPDGYPDSIVWTAGSQAADQVSLVEAGGADYMADQIPADAFAQLSTQYTPQLHVASNSTMFAFMNTTMPPFDNLDVRRAVNFAVDRGHVADLRGGPSAAKPTCQVLPPNFPGYEPYCPYTKDPGSAGHWAAPDLDAARALVAGSGTSGMTVVVGPFAPRLDPVGEYIAQVLGDLGYVASYEAAASGDDVFKAIFVDKRVAIGGFEFGADYPAPDTFLGQFTCQPGDGESNYCSADLDAAVSSAGALQSSDPATASRKWAAVDRMVTDLALWAPLVNEGSDVVSAQVGNYQYNPALNVLLDQAWVQ